MTEDIPYFPDKVLHPTPPTAAGTVIALRSSGGILALAARGALFAVAFGLGGAMLWNYSFAKGARVGAAVGVTTGLVGVMLRVLGFRQ